MSTPFDRLKNNAFDSASRIMGVDAIWGEYTERVLYKEPDAQEERADINFHPTHYEIEYRFDQFPGLYESVREGNIEIVTAKGTEFTARYSYKKFDGETIIVQLVPN